MKPMIPHQIVFSVQADLGTDLQTYDTRRTCSFSVIKHHSTPGSITVDVQHVGSYSWQVGDCKSKK